MPAIRILIRVLTAVCTEAKNGMVKRVEALRGHPTKAVFTVLKDRR